MKKVWRERVFWLFTTLLLRNSALVFLRSNHWSEHVEIIRGVANAVAGRTPPAVGGTEISHEPPAVGEEQLRDGQICAFLSRLISQSQDGAVRPVKLKGPDWQALRQIVPPHTLAQFIR